MTHKTALVISILIALGIALVLLASCKRESPVVFRTPKTTGVWGIDISHHQGRINWRKLAENPPFFIFMKATEGISHKDTRYRQNRKSADKAGILTGAYHFFSYTSDGALQAKHFLTHAKLKPGDLLPVLDCEYKKNMPPRATVAKELVKFIKTIESELGVKPIIYCEYGYYTRYLKGHITNDYPLWICDFRRKPQCNHVFWQKTDRFKHPAFRGTVDLNEFSGTEEGLIKYTIR